MIQCSQNQLEENLPQPHLVPVLVPVLVLALALVLVPVLVPVLEQELEALGVLAVVLLCLRLLVAVEQAPALAQRGRP